MADVRNTEQQKMRLKNLLSGRSVDTPADVDYVAEDLLANGVIVPPCQVGDTVYYFVGNEIYHGTIDTFQIDTKENWYIAYCKTDYNLTGQIKLAFWEFGESVFLSREEAEAKLEKCKKEGRFW